MRILIAAGIYPPEIGGPAFYARSLKEALEGEGHEAEPVLYGNLKKLPPGVRHFCYCLKLLARSRGADAVIAFDTFAVGVPAAIACALARKPLAARVGGDVAWEMYVERTKDLLPLPRFYEHRDRWNWKERIAFFSSRWVARRARVVFSSRWQLDIWREAYGLDPARARVIENAIGPALEPIAPARKNFVFYTRQIALKNAEAFRRAFAKAKERHPEIELEEGVLGHRELIEAMRRCYAVVLPSISDVTPNYIIDSIRCGKPFLLTKYSAFAGRFGEYGVLVDPLDEADMRRGVEALADPATYAVLQKKVAAFAEVRAYRDVARDFLAVLSKRA